MHFLATLVLDGRGLDLDQVSRHLADRLHLVPALRWRVKRVPLGWGRPVFVDDRRFGLGRHLREHTLAAPGSDAQLDGLQASLAAVRLDRAMALWDLTLVHGLQDGRQAVILRVHHCLMDGSAMVHSFRCLLGDLADRAVVEPWSPGRAPNSARLIVGALGENGRSARRLPALLARTKRHRDAVAATAVPEPPPCLINQARTADRRSARTTLSLEDLRLVKQTAGVTVNDVALAVVSGALRAYLLARQALPAPPLTVSIPVGLEPAGAAPRTSGNRIAAVTATLATDVVDPWQRLRTIHTSTALGKQVHALGEPGLLGDWLSSVPPVLLDHAIRAQERKRRRRPGSVQPVANVVVSNVRGPVEALHLGPARIDELYLSGPPNNGVGTNIVLLDLGGHVHVSIMCFADSVAGPEELAMGLHDALAELVHIAVTRPGVRSDVVA
jgi:WS/DGAT/MGAT family acyltransferase